MPVALLEYADAGLPIVCTAVGQCADLLDGGRAGRLVAPGDAEGIARALLDCLEQSEEREQLGRAARERVGAKFGVNLSIAAVLRSYASVITHAS